MPSLTVRTHGSVLAHADAVADEPSFHLSDGNLVPMEDGRGERGLRPSLLEDLRKVRRAPRATIAISRRSRRAAHRPRRADRAHRASTAIAAAATTTTSAITTTSATTTTAAAEDARLLEIRARGGIYMDMHMGHGNMRSMGPLGAVAVAWRAVTWRAVTWLGLRSYTRTRPLADV